MKHRSILLMDLELRKQDARTSYQSGCKTTEATEELQNVCAEPGNFCNLKGRNVILRESIHRVPAEEKTFRVLIFCLYLTDRQAGHIYSAY